MHHKKVDFYIGGRIMKTKIISILLCLGLAQGLLAEEKDAGKSGRVSLPDASLGQVADDKGQIRVSITPDKELSDAKSIVRELCEEDVKGAMTKARGHMDGIEHLTEGLLVKSHNQLNLLELMYDKAKREEIKKNLELMKTYSKAYLVEKEEKKKKEFFNVLVLIKGRLEKSLPTLKLSNINMLFNNRVKCETGKYNPISHKCEYKSGESLIKETPLFVESITEKASIKLIGMVVPEGDDQKAKDKFAEDLFEMIDVLADKYLTASVCNTEFKAKKGDSEIKQGSVCTVYDLLNNTFKTTLQIDAERTFNNQVSKHQAIMDSVETQKLFADKKATAKKMWENEQDNVAKHYSQEGCHDYLAEKIAERKAKQAPKKEKEEEARKPAQVKDEKKKQDKPTEKKDEGKAEGKTPKAGGQ